jgi:hypothetical protein
MDSAGNLYSTAALAGMDNNGLILELAPPRKNSQSWRDLVILDFNGQDASSPGSTPAFDSQGDLWVTAYEGGAFGCGTLLELGSPFTSSSRWVVKGRHNFTNGSDGGYPFAGATIASDGAVYGTTYWDGTHTL